MRYFNISVNISLPGNRSGFAATQFESEEFPSFNEIYGKFQEITEKDVQIVVIGIFEFKNKNDYNSYRGIQLFDVDNTYSNWMDGLQAYLAKKIFLSVESFDKIAETKEAQLVDMFTAGLKYEEVFTKLF